MGSLQLEAPPQGRVGQGLGLDRRCRLKHAVVGNRSGSRSAAKWTIPENSMPTRLVRIAGGSMVVVRRCGQREPLRADFQEERRTVRRHETDRHVGPEQKHRQRQAGREISLPVMTKKSHMPG